MIKIKNSKKRLKQNKKRNKINSSKRSMLNTLIKKCIQNIKIKKKKYINLTISLIDKLIYKKIINKKKASRYKKKIFYIYKKYN